VCDRDAPLDLGRLQADRPELVRRHIGEDRLGRLSRAQRPGRLRRPRARAAHREIGLPDQGIRPAAHLRQTFTHHAQLGDGQAVVEAWLELDPEGNLARLAGDDPDQLPVGIDGLRILGPRGLPNREAVQQHEHARVDLEARLEHVGVGQVAAR
jgi:hypothetical protein